MKEPILSNEGSEANISRGLEPKGEVFVVLREPTHNSLTFLSSQNVEVIRIEPDGRLFWHQREVKTDDDFRAAMIDLAKAFMVTK